MEGCHLPLMPWVVVFLAFEFWFDPSLILPCLVCWLIGAHIAEYTWKSSSVPIIKPVNNSRKDEMHFHFLYSLGEAKKAPYSKEYLSEEVLWTSTSMFLSLPGDQWNSLACVEEVKIDVTLPI